LIKINVYSVLRQCSLLSIFIEDNKSSEVFGGGIEDFPNFILRRIVPPPDD